MPSKTFIRLEAEKQERVMRAATKEFQENGYDQANIGRIADLADVAKGSLYQYFENKRDLFLYCVQWTLTYFMAEIDMQTPLQDMDVYEYFRAGGMERAEILKTEGLLVAFSQDVFLGRFAELTREATERMWKTADAYMMGLIQNGQRKGTVRKDLPDDILLLFFKGVTGEFDKLVFTYLMQENYELTAPLKEKISQSLDHMLALLQQGMGEKDVYLCGETQQKL